MTTIRQQDFIDSIADALQFISYYHPADFIRSLAAAYQREASPAAKDAMAQILTNSRMSAEGHRPVCQDTGIVVAFVRVGMDVRWEGATQSIAEMVNAGVRKAYLHPDNVLRASQLRRHAAYPLRTGWQRRGAIYAAQPGGLSRRAMAACTRCAAGKSRHADAR